MLCQAHKIVCGDAEDGDGAHLGEAAHLALGELAYRLAPAGAFLDLVSDGGPVFLAGLGEGLRVPLIATCGSIPAPVAFEEETRKMPQALFATEDEINGLSAATRCFGVVGKKALPWSPRFRAGCASARQAMSPCHNRQGCARVGCPRRRPRLRQQ